MEEGDGDHVGLEIDGLRIVHRQGGFEGSCGRVFGRAIKRKALTFVSRLLEEGSRGLVQESDCFCLKASAPGLFERHEVVAGHRAFQLTHDWKGFVFGCEVNRFLDEYGGVSLLGLSCTDFNEDGKCSDEWCLGNRFEEQGKQEQGKR
jgi:hypothetical protein